MQHAQHVYRIIRNLESSIQDIAEYEQVPLLIAIDWEQYIRNIIPNINDDNIPNVLAQLREGDDDSSGDDGYDDDSSDDDGSDDDSSDDDGSDDDSSDDLDDNENNANDSEYDNEEPPYNICDGDNEEHLEDAANLQVGINYDNPIIIEN